jgi:choline dehydrogenase-like flavoprotein
MIYEADIAIIGSGVAGALIAADLAARGLKVIIIEAGKEIDRADAVDNYRNAAIKIPESPYPLNAEAMHPTALDIDTWYQQAGPDQFSSTYLKVVGGTTWHWLGTALRFLPSDFETKSRYDSAVNWPITYSDLEGFYGLAERELGVSGSVDDLGSPRTSNYTMEGIPQTYLDKSFYKALSKTRFQVSPTPQARNSTDWGGRPACCGNASCIPVCPIQAKYDATVHIDRAVNAGAVLLSQSTAVEFSVADNDLIQEVKFIGWDGAVGAVKAKFFVLAANAIESPRLLLNSMRNISPGGISNSSDQVGRNLMDHPTQLSWALSSNPVYPYRGPLSTSGIENLRDGSFRSIRAAFRTEIGNDGWSWPTGAPMTTAIELVNNGLSGKTLAQELERKTARHVRLASLVEQLPNEYNRISLHKNRTDMYGVPLPKIEYKVGEYERLGLLEAKLAHDEIFQNLGVTEVYHSDRIYGAGHIIGTLRMGSDAKTSVVNSDLQSYDHPNLFVSGSSTFPTSATANPTLTIAALALRLSDRIKIIFN